MTDRTLARRLLVSGVLIAATLYVAMVVVPTFNAAVQVARAEQRDREARLTPAPSIAVPSVTAPPSAMIAVPSAPTATVSPVADLDPTAGVVLYSLVGTLMRTSAPALYYPLVYPSAHAFYGLDVGQDIVCSPRLGCQNNGMPDDNLVVWDYMNPEFHGGSITAPFQFALYSQVGVLGAITGAFLIGVGLAAVWVVVRRTSRDIVARSLLGAVTILLAVNLAIDSPRNSIAVSYGAAWGFVFVAITLVLCRLTDARLESRRAARIQSQAGIRR